MPSPANSRPDHDDHTAHARQGTPGSARRAPLAATTEGPEPMTHHRITGAARRWSRRLAVPAALAAGALPAPAAHAGTYTIYSCTDPGTAASLDEAPGWS